MSVEPHDLHRDFPEFEAEIHNLKQSDAHFRRLFEEYHDLDREVRNIEEAGSNTSDEFLEQKKKERAKLKDELFAMLNTAKGAA
jgi:uncharacterized protein YdcH (DUF465 family)